MIDNNSLIRYIIGASRIKYEVLDNLYAGITFSQYRMGVMYVDAHSIFYRLFKERDLVSIYNDHKEELIQDIVIGFYNVLGHYRRYMATRMGLDNDIYVTFNQSQPKYNSKLIPNFGTKYVRRYDVSDPNFGFINKCINMAWKFILELSPFFEGIYCIDNNGIDDFAVFGRIGFMDDIFYTIYSRNLYATQMLRSNVVQLYNRRDNSYIITNGTCYKNGVLREYKTSASDLLSADMLPLFWSLCGCNDVSVDALKYSPRFTTLIKRMNVMAEDRVLIPGMSIYSFLDSVGDYIDINSKAPTKLALKIDRDVIIARYKALSIPLSYKAITSDQWAKIVSQTYDVYGESELEHMNELLAEGNVDPNLLELTNLNMSIAPKYSHDIIS